MVDKAGKASDIPEPPVEKDEAEQEYVTKAEFDAFVERVTQNGQGL